MDIYNAAWAGKWAMVPALPDEVEKVAKDLKLILDPDLAFHRGGCTAVLRWGCAACCRT